MGQKHCYLHSDSVLPSVGHGRHPTKWKVMENKQWKKISDTHEMHLIQTFLSPFPKAPGALTVLKYPRYFDLETPLVLHGNFGFG